VVVPAVQVGRGAPVRRACAAAVTLLVASLHGAAATCPTFVAWLSSSKNVPTPAAVRANPAAHAVRRRRARVRCRDLGRRVLGQEPSRGAAARGRARRRGALGSPVNAASRHRAGHMHVGCLNARRRRLVAPALTLLRMQGAHAGYSDGFVALTVAPDRKTVVINWQLTGIDDAVRMTSAGVFGPATKDQVAHIPAPLYGAAHCVSACARG